jgi:hypothetical protein
MGAISIVASPIIAVVACGTKEPAKKPTIPKISSIVDIDLDKIKSPMELILKMNESMHFYKPKKSVPVTVLGKPVPVGGDRIKNDNYPLKKSQYKTIADNVITDKTFNFTYGDKKLAVSSNFDYDQTTIKNSIEDLLSNWSPENGTKANDRFNKRSPNDYGHRLYMGNFLFYIENASFPMGNDISGYYSLPDDA